MPCPSCGGVHSSEQCPESATTAAILSTSCEPESLSDQMSPDDLMEDNDFDATSDTLAAKPTSRLIEFPGAFSRSTVPQWRKELSERVREVQERRAREAAAEAEEAERRRKEQVSLYPPQLELLPEAEVPEMNPIVAAALRRIKRAHRASHAPVPRSQSPSTAVGVASAVSGTTKTDAPAPQRTSFAAAAPAKIPTAERAPAGEEAPAPQRAPNLVVVPSVVRTQPPPDSSPPKPKRVISDDAADPALSYLDSILAPGTEPVFADQRAPVSSRLTAAVSDIVVVGFLSLPFAAILELQNQDWHDPQTLGLMAGIAAVVMFIYLTVTTAVTGSTLGMRLVSLRAIDAKTGLIPTGTQSAARALFYILSLATLGLGFLYALVDADGKTAHDHLSRTAVVRA
jgi:uncharacterized RDD family membrane protein YckC